MCALLAACGAAPNDADESVASDNAELSRGRTSVVYVESNDANANSVLAFVRRDDGQLIKLAEAPTGGLGLGRSLGSQGAVATALDGRFVLAVDAGSNEISAFRARGAHLELRSRVPSGGVRPVSVAAHGPFVYVVNQGEPAMVTGFRLNDEGTLVPIAEAIQPLSAPNANPAQVGVSPSGDAVVVSEKASNVLSVFRVTRRGGLEPAESVPSAGTTPFGFAFDGRGDLVVSEAATMSASSYRFDRHGELVNVSAVVSDHQTAPCWVATSADSRYAYVANAGSASISGYRIDVHGSLSLLDETGVTAATGEGSRPLDMAVDGDRHLYLLDAGNHALVEYAIERDGALRYEAKQANLPSFAAGVAAR
ncbi:MAG TPA: beta-propeller fold lactonase family protein [Polyangiaceae bacterium]|nr:beta-propeller fold lactonase family protein [Polyangiaceae bacterium]